ncbi:flagellar hook capping FlgD N-terminal domain-containing protein [Exiguobacterium sp. AM39-5BH]|uniref:flagellar hook capping FlgD N-terminal domain-containing protein n=1 Tax=Exiguobacterium sp. AM39-5BH TaxID=2292355 RepID=UPI000FE18727|nr:flagellar hook capping FlgD N-terminal domain-containing protein [Exiguobacterium sp. AM39-5BH]RHB51132.1 flagellar hook capping protein [Exiguobacterium sp. AM39-5BH]
MTTIQPKTNDYALPDQSMPKATNQYDKNMFLKLLMAQLGNQDPMSPMEDREFISQMAQFSSLEQMQGISKQLDSVLVDRHMASISEFSNMIGKTVLYTNETDSETIKGSGRVVSISRTDESGYMADLEDGSSVSVYNITSIKQA